MSAGHFFIAGAQRSGTTFLCHLLAQHPEISLARPLRPEVKFFLRDDLSDADLEEYRRAHFADAPADSLRGEKSTTYMERPDAARRIRRLLPAARVLFVLRDPVERALSNYWFSVEAGADRSPLEEALCADEPSARPYDPRRFSTSPFAYLARGRYRELLAPWEALFPAARLGVFLFETLVGDPAAVARVFRFLGVDPSVRPRRPETPVNASPRRRPASPELLERLARYYEEPNRRLAADLGLDLSAWRRTEASNGRHAPRPPGPSRTRASTSEPLVPLHRARPLGRELDYLTRALESERTCGDGPFTLACQRLLERELGSARALLTTSCTHALELAALLLGVGPGDEVIVPSFSFVSTANAFAMRGARPVFVDIRPDTLNLDEELVPAAIGPRTRAIVPVHYGGVGCAMDRLVALAQRRGVAVVEDNAHGLFGLYRGRPLGSLGLLAALSFHETKNFSCGEGGALLVNDPALVERAEILREKGTDRSRFFRGEVDKYTWIDLGSSYLPSDLLAAVLLAQLERRERILRGRQRAWIRYQKGLADWSSAHGFSLPVVPDDCRSTFHCFYLLAHDPESRNRLLRHLRGRGVQASFHYVPLHLSAMGRRHGGRPGALPVSESVASRLLRLPLYEGIEGPEQERVIEAVRELGG